MPFAFQFPCHPGKGQRVFAPASETGSAAPENTDAHTGEHPVAQTDPDYTVETEWGASVSLADVQAAFDMAGDAVRRDDPRASALQARALFLFQTFNARHHRAIQIAAHEQIKLIHERLPCVDEAQRAVLDAKLKVWEGMLLEATAALARSEASQKASASRVRDGRAA
ncbi:hypothetical protein E4Z66_06585 [Aliishimia ponticola]|uniref:Uncharacterized protein n=1 Tax=Aliishimia ponticola TaxID=2499833 RepID=A0A4S4NB66_9RHOB|nr:hypothetical protein [Aliishimia ponticola]THH36612.1 hypothetical protein E4Z66_06585 [Aliishimia ponticola]